MNDDKIETPESLASTIRPPPKFSQRPTIPIVKFEEPAVVKQFPPIKYKFYLIGVIIVAIIIISIIFITKPLMSHSMPERTVFNLAPMVIPNDSVVPAPTNIAPEIQTHNKSESKPILKISPIPNTKVIKPKEPKEKDYGINDLINPYDEKIIYKL